MYIQNMFGCNTRWYSTMMSGLIPSQGYRELCTSDRQDWGLLSDGCGFWSRGWSFYPLHISVSRIKLQYISAFVIQQSKGPSLGISQLTLIGVPTVSVLGCVRIHILQHHSSKQPKSTSTSTSVASFPFSYSPYHIANLLLKVLLKQWCTLGSNFWQSCSLFTKNKTKQRCFYFRNLSQVSS